MVSKKKIIKIGIIGAGNWGKKYIKTIQEIECISLIAISSKNQKTKEIIPSDCRFFEDWRKILNLTDIDGIIVSTPTYSHYEICREVLNRNIPVLAEKPLSTKIEEVKNLFEICKNKNSILMINYIHLYHMGFQEIFNIFENKNSNEFINIFSESGNYGPFRKDTRALWDWGVHDVAMMLKLLKEYPIKIRSKLLKKSEKGYQYGELIEANFDFSSGSKANLTFGNLQRKKIKKFIASSGSKKYIYDPFDDKNKFNHLTSESPLKRCIKKFKERIINSDNNLEDIELTLQITDVLNTIEKQINSKFDNNKNLK